MGGRSQAFYELNEVINTFDEKVARAKESQGDSDFYADAPELNLENIKTSQHDVTQLLRWIMLKMQHLELNEYVNYYDCFLKARHKVLTPTGKRFVICIT